MSAARTGSWEAAHPRLTSFLGLLERLVARIPTGGRAPEAAPTTRAPSAGPELRPLGVIEGAAGKRVVVGLQLDAMPARPSVFGTSRRGKGATR
jgi:hypothetical protein